VLTLRWPGPDADALRERARALLLAPGRAVLGVAGAPASGKSTLTEQLALELAADHPGAVAVVGMDAFHIGHRVLERHGLTAVKGAPHTFDARGYVALLARVRASSETVYAPEFHREIEDSLAHVVEVGPEVGLVITEGNYLLLAEPPWDEVRALLDEAWFVHLADDERRRRMVLRHERHGHSPEDARARTFGSDEANAVLVDRSGRDRRPDVWVEHVVPGPAPDPAAVSTGGPR
jgi:pantothenate kinase